MEYCWRQSYNLSKATHDRYSEIIIQISIFQDVNNHIKTSFVTK